MKDNKKEGFFKKIKNVFMENEIIRLIIYICIIYIAGVSVPFIYFLMVWVGVMILSCKIRNPKEIKNGRLVSKEGKIDQIIVDFADKIWVNIKKTVKKIKKKIRRREVNVIDLTNELKESNEINKESINNIEEINNRIQELNNGSIVRDSKEIAKEKEELLSLIKIVELYQGGHKQEKTINYSEVPTINVDNDCDKVYTYKKK